MYALTGSRVALSCGCDYGGLVRLYNKPRNIYKHDKRYISLASLDEAD